MRPQPGHDPAPTADELSALLERAGRGEQDAWRRIIGLYARRVFALARSRLRDPDLAEEVTQSVFATVAAKLSGEPGYAERGRFEPWLFRVAVNRIRDEVRRRQRHARQADGDALLAVAGPLPAPPEHANREELEHLRVALATLGDADRQVIELRHHAGLSFAQISELLEEPLGTLLARHHRALRKLKTLLAPAAVNDEPAGGPR